MNKDQEEQDFERLREFLYHLANRSNWNLAEKIPVRPTNVKFLTNESSYVDMAIMNIFEAKLRYGCSEKKGALKPWEEAILALNELNKVIACGE